MHVERLNPRMVVRREEEKREREREREKEKKETYVLAHQHLSLPADGLADPLHLIRSHIVSTDNDDLGVFVQITLQFVKVGLLPGGFAPSPRHLVL